jgi:hypothetical protein
LSAVAPQPASSNAVTAARAAPNLSSLNIFVPLFDADTSAN